MAYLLSKFSLPPTPNTPYRSSLGNSILDSPAQPLEEDDLPAPENMLDEERNGDGPGEGEVEEDRVHSNDTDVAGRHGVTHLAGREYTTVVRTLHLKRKFTGEQLEEMLDLARDADPRSRELKMFAAMITTRDLIDGLSTSINLRWTVPHAAQAEITKDIYAYLLSPKCPAYVQSATLIFMNHVERCRVRMQLEASVFQSSSQHRTLAQFVSKRMGERRSWIHKKLRATLDSSLAEVQRELTMAMWPFEFEIGHWIRIAFMRATMRVHLKQAGSKVTSEDGTVENVAKEYWTYLDECLKVSKARLGGDPAKWASFLRNILNADTDEFPVGQETPRTVNKPLNGRSSAQIETELAA